VSRTISDRIFAFCPHCEEWSEIRLCIDCLYAANPHMASRFSSRWNVRGRRSRMPDSSVIAREGR
jgi:hypothetical protein